MYLSHRSLHIVPPSNPENKFATLKLHSLLNRKRHLSINWESSLVLTFGSISSVRLSESYTEVQMVLCPHLCFSKCNERIWMILQAEQETDMGTFALGKMIHLLLRNTWFGRLLGLHPNTRCSPYPAILTVRPAKAKRTQNKSTKTLLLVVF